MRGLRMVAATLLPVGAQQAPPPYPLRVTDVSPDAPAGRPQDANAADPSGRILSVVIDPTHDAVMYAASEYSGVWKSTDAGLTWQQASIGLRSGLTRFSYGPFLAIDALDPKRLMY